MSVEKFEAEVLFLDPTNVPLAVKALADVDCKFEINLDAVDEHGPTVFGTVTGMTELSEDDVGWWLCRVITPFSGDVVTWGLTSLIMARQRGTQRSGDQN